MTAVLWIAVAFMLIGAAMLVVDVGAPAVWIALIAIGIASVVVERTRQRA
jgi:hypothetical protein